jgi:hypothetical protein
VTGPGPTAAVAGRPQAGSAQPAQVPPAPGTRAPAAGRRARRFLAGRGTPAVLRLLLIGLVLGSVIWGVVGAWAVSQHASAAHEVVGTSEPLSLAAQQMYQKLSDADVTATTAFLKGPSVSLADRGRYEDDLATADADLATLRSGGPASSGQLSADLAAVATGLPVYASYVQQAQDYNSFNLSLAGGSVMQSASEEMHLVLLPAANAIYVQDSAALTAAAAQATGLPWIVVAVLIAVGIGFCLLRTQRWLGRRTHRVVNYGLLLASAAVVVSALWLVVAFAAARSDFHQGIGHGSTPAEELAQSVIAAQQARGDQVLNLISRTGSTSFSGDFDAEKGRIDSLLTAAEGSSGAGADTAQVTAAQSAASIWYGSSATAFGLDNRHEYDQETGLVVGTSGADFMTLVNDLQLAIARDQGVFRSDAATGSSEFGGVEAVVIVAALLMAAGCGWGLSRRLAEYR